MLGQRTEGQRPSCICRSERSIRHRFEYLLYRLYMLSNDACRACTVRTYFIVTDDRQCAFVFTHSQNCCASTTTTTTMKKANIQNRHTNQQPRGCISCVCIATLPAIYLFIVWPHFYVHVFCFAHGDSDSDLSANVFTQSCNDCIQFYCLSGWGVVN